MTEDEVFEAYSKGLPEGFTPDYSTQQRRVIKQCDALITAQLFVPGDVLQFFKQRAEEQGTEWRKDMVEVLINHQRNGEMRSTQNGL